MPRKTNKPIVTSDDFTFSNAGEFSFGDDAFAFDASNDFAFGAGTVETPDPLAGVEYEGKIEPDAKRELSALEEAFKQRKLAEMKRFALNTDSEYWVAFCFPSREAKEAFLTAAGLMADGDKYIDGVAAAKKLGIDVPKPDATFSTTFNINKRWNELTMD